MDNLTLLGLFIVFILNFFVSFAIIHVTIYNKLSDFINLIKEINSNNFERNSNNLERNSRYYASINETESLDEVRIDILNE